MFFKKKLEKIKLFVIGILGSTFARTLFSTIVIEERPGCYPKKFKHRGENVIYAYWHSFMLAPGYVTRNLGIKVLISRHTDGDYVAQVAQRLGFSPVRGSTTRGGGNALLNMVKETKKGMSIVITPDGPRGPRFIVQPGIIFLSQKTGSPIIPVSLGMTNYWELASWDRFCIPKPFSKVIVMYGDPIKIPPEIDKTEIEKYRIFLEKTLNELTVETDRLANGI